MEAHSSRPFYLHSPWAFHSLHNFFILLVCLNHPDYPSSLLLQLLQCQEKVHVSCKIRWVIPKRSVFFNNGLVSWGHHRGQTSCASTGVKFEVHIDTLLEQSSNESWFYVMTYHSTHTSCASIYQIVLGNWNGHQVESVQILARLPLETFHAYLEPSWPQILSINPHIYRVPLWRVEHTRKGDLKIKTLVTGLLVPIWIVVKLVHGNAIEKQHKNESKLKKALTTLKNGHCEHCLFCKSW